MDEPTMDLTVFNVHCLGVIGDVAQGRLDRVVLTQHGRPVAAIVRVETDPPALWGAMRGSVVVAPDVDLTAATGEAWEASGAPMP